MTAVECQEETYALQQTRVRNSAVQLSVRLRDDRHLGCALRSFADQRVAVTAGGGNETRGRVAAQRRDVYHLRAVAYPERAARIIGVRRIADRGVCAVSDTARERGRSRLAQKWRRGSSRER